jgi:hypothetical protein
MSTRLLSSLLVFAFSTICAYYGYVFRTKKWEKDILYFVPFFGWIRNLVVRLRELNDGAPSNRAFYTSTEKHDDSKRSTSQHDIPSLVGNMLTDRGNPVSALISHAVSLDLLARRASESIHLEPSEVIEKAAFVTRCLDELEEGLSPTARSIVAKAIDRLEHWNVDYVYDESIYSLREAQSRAEKRYRESR